jgi:hypothetical protein
MTASGVSLTASFVDSRSYASVAHQCHVTAEIVRCGYRTGIDNPGCRPGRYVALGPIAGTCSRH